MLPATIVFHYGYKRLLVAAEISILMRCGCMIVNLATAPQVQGRRYYTMLVYYVSIRQASNPGLPSLTVMECRQECHYLQRVNGERAAVAWGKWYYEVNVLKHVKRPNQPAIDQSKFNSFCPLVCFILLFVSIAHQKIICRS